MFLCVTSIQIHLHRTLYIYHRCINNIFIIHHQCELLWYDSETNTYTTGTKSSFGMPPIFVTPTSSLMFTTPQRVYLWVKEWLLNQNKHSGQFGMGGGWHLCSFIEVMDAKDACESVDQFYKLPRDHSCCVFAGWWELAKVWWQDGSAMTHLYWGCTTSGPHHLTHPPSRG